MIRSNNLLKHKKKVYSQNGEDGVIEEILKEIGVKYFTCCEFGAGDGIHLSNSRNLILNNNKWRCVFIESNKQEFKKLKRNYEDNPNVICINQLVDMEKNTISMILNEYGMSHLDCLSIDIDGLDYEIFSTLGIYPRLLCIEINAGHSPSSYNMIDRSVAANDIGQPFPLFSKIAREKGYGLTCYTGNAFYVKTEELAKSKYVELTDEEAYIEFLNNLEQDGKDWLYLVNKALVPPYYKYRNPFLNKKDLNINFIKSIRILLRALAKNQFQKFLYFASRMRQIIQKVIFKNH